MGSTGSNAVFVLKLIGSLFSVVTLLMLCVIVYLMPGANDQDAGLEYKGFLASSFILTTATAIIAVFIWWIVSNKRKFLNYD